MNELREISDCLRHIANNFESLDDKIENHNCRIQILEDEVRRNYEFKKKLFALLNEEING